MTVDKVAEEWTVIRYFREQYASFPKGKLNKSESPDFILQLNRKKQIGIELTRFDDIGKYHQEGVSQNFTQLLEKKENKLRLYKKHLLSEYWLIIITETVVASNLFQEMKVHKSKFNKVFIFDIFLGQVIEK